MKSYADYLSGLRWAFFAVRWAVQVLSFSFVRRLFPLEFQEFINTCNLIILWVSLIDMIIECGLRKCDGQPRNEGNNIKELRVVGKVILVIKTIICTFQWVDEHIGSNFNHKKTLDVISNMLTFIQICVFGISQHEQPLRWWFGYVAKVHGNWIFFIDWFRNLTVKCKMAMEEASEEPQNGPDDNNTLINQHESNENSLTEIVLISNDSNLAISLANESA